VFALTPALTGMQSLIAYKLLHFACTIV